MACLKWISNNDCTWPEYNLGEWNVGEQALQRRLGLKVVERLHCSVSMRVYRLYIRSANHITIRANKIEN